MGASSSKAARQTAQAAARPRPPWAAATPESIDAAARARPNTVGRASATKDDFIMRDSQDPQLLEQLSKIGPVSVHAQKMPFQTAQSARMTKILQTRQATEEAAETNQRNRLSADAVADMLDERKTAKTQADLHKIAKQYNVDLEALNALARYVNAPSVNTELKRPINDQDDEGIPKLKAYWTRAPIDGATAQPHSN